MRALALLAASRRLVQTLDWPSFRRARHRLEAYATLHRSVVAVGARNSPQKAFREIARHSGEQCSIGFQPVSGGSRLQPGSIPTTLSRREPSQTDLNFAPFSPG